MTQACGTKDKGRGEEGEEGERERERERLKGSNDIIWELKAYILGVQLVLPHLTIALIK